MATASLDEARDRWARAGFAVSRDEERCAGLRFARMASGAIEIDLCTADPGSSGVLADAISEAAIRGGGIVGWTWGIAALEGQPDQTIELPGTNGAQILAPRLAGVFTAAVAANADAAARRERLRDAIGDNQNTVDFLEHVVVMAPVLEDAISAQEAIEVPCKRIREVGNGMRQAFFKLERTVIEIVAPSRERPGCWGLAFMCTDIAKAVTVARENGLQATEPKKAIQGGLIARIVDSLDGVAVAYMQAP